MYSLAILLKYFLTKKCRSCEWLSNNLYNVMMNKKLCSTILFLTTFKAPLFLRSTYLHNTGNYIINVII